jgi:hypothetical protein
MRATIKPSSPRYPEWTKVFGNEPVMFSDATKSYDGEECYWIDSHALTVRQMANLSSYLSRAWKVPVNEVPEILFRERRRVLVRCAEVARVPENDTLF